MKQELSLSAKHILNNKELLAAMDTVVSYLNHEDGIEPWLMCGLPDAWDGDDLGDVASDMELMDGACRAFRHSMLYARFGWFTKPFGDDSVSITYGADDDTDDED